MRINVTTTTLVALFIVSPFSVNASKIQPIEVRAYNLAETEGTTHLNKSLSSEEKIAALCNIVAERSKYKCESYNHRGAVAKELCGNSHVIGCFWNEKT